MFFFLFIFTSMTSYIRFELDEYFAFFFIFPEKENFQIPNDERREKKFSFYVLHHTVAKKITWPRDSHVTLRPRSCDVVDIVINVSPDFVAKCWERYVDCINCF